MGGKGRIKKRIDRNFGNPVLRNITKLSGVRRGKILAWIKSNIKAYADEWEANANFLENNGIYRQIADFADFRNGEWWLDLGCGSGNLISEVCKRVETTPIGIDINTYLLKMAKESLIEEGLDVNYNVSYGIVEDPRLGFKLVPKEREEFQIEEGKPNIILDDMRFPYIVTRHFPKHKPDKIVYTLPGGYTSFLYEFLQKLTHDSYSIFLVMNKVIASNACRFLCEGKEFITAVRTSIPENAIDNNTLGFPDTKPYLEATDEAYLDYPEEAERLNSINGTLKIVNPTSPFEKRNIKMQLKKYRRTSVPFSSYIL